MAKDGNGNAQYEKPHGYAPDSLTNHEIGWKTEFFDHRLQFNGSLYHMEWDNVQMLFFNPQALGNTTFGVNGPNYTESLRRRGQLQRECVHFVRAVHQVGSSLASARARPAAVLQVLGWNWGAGTRARPPID